MLAAIVTYTLGFATAALALATIAFAIQAAAGIFPHDPSYVLSSRRPTIAVLIPAHNEEQDIEATLLRIKIHLTQNDRLLVVADNCTDATAAIAAAAGAEVLVRDEPSCCGKGFALAAGLRYLNASPPEVIVFIDADCEISPHGVEVLARACAAANAPLQCLDFMIPNPDRPAPPRLAEFAWRVRNDLRPRGYARLGLPYHLLGTGMALPWSMAEPELLATGHLTEDKYFGLELAIKGYAPRFFPGVRVTSYFPDAQRAHVQQKQRWMHGHFGLMNSHLPRLLYHGLRRRDIGLLALAADLAVPPLGLLAVANVALVVLCFSCMIGIGSTVPLGLAAIDMVLFSFPLATAWYLCGRDLIGMEEIKQVPRHVVMVLRSAVDLARGHKTKWLRADRSQASVRDTHYTHR
ncbi:glycosyltransferase family 2 protein [Bradyrhizobium sp. CCBAU 45389]|uniref:glycosyltransferase family 2 protein n=1 Tax=Bradyrhizobium sp. CCBAU 45389 TaxID=858429 RepID=UPI002305AAAF|nr:glycosyltransferase [Bradyrhizobium sp. CCBAU 45389]